jgi:uncharacterized protein YcbX
MNHCRIAGLWRYPVKSARGTFLQSARLCTTGFEHDREWLIVDSRGRFLTQREQPGLALLEVNVSESSLELRAPGHEPLQLPLLSGNTALRTVTIWRDECLATDQGPVAARWISGFLGADASAMPWRLVRFPEFERRLSDGNWTGTVQAPNQFSDGFPLLVLSQASLDDLNARVGRVLPINRFRPNILIDGVEPYTEDRIEELRIGAITLRIVKPCTRCVITTTDQQQGVRDGDEPLRTLRSYRYDSNLQGVAFGQNAIIVGGVGEQMTLGQAARYTTRV